MNGYVLGVLTFKKKKKKRRGKFPPNKKELLYIYIY